MAVLPALVVVSGPMGSGKTTLAHKLARTSARSHQAFDRVSVDAPSIEVDTTDGYTPGLSDIAAFVNRRG